MNENMSELEIKNFAYNFINLINIKDAEICRLKQENNHLHAITKQLLEPTHKLTLEEVRDGGKPVYAYSLVQHKYIGWVIPSQKYLGVISGNRGIYKYYDYDEKWIAYPSKINE